MTPLTYTLRYLTIIFLSLICITPVISSQDLGDSYDEVLISVDYDIEERSNDYISYNLPELPFTQVTYFFKFDEVVMIVVRHDFNAKQFEKNYIKISKYTKAKPTIIGGFVVWEVNGLTWAMNPNITLHGETNLINGVIDSL